MEEFTTEDRGMTLSEAEELLRGRAVILTSLPPKGAVIPAEYSRLESSLRQFLSESGFVEIRPLLFVANTFSGKMSEVVTFLESSKDKSSSGWLKFLGLCQSDNSPRIVHVLADKNDPETTIKVWDHTDIDPKDQRAA